MARSSLVGCALLLSLALACRPPEDPGAIAPTGEAPGAELLNRLTTRGVPPGIVTLGEKQSPSGTHYRLLWHGLPIFGLGGKVALGDATATFPDVQFAAGLNPATAAKISEAKAGSTVLAQLSLENARVETTELGLLPRVETEEGTSPTEAPRRTVTALELVYRVVVDAGPDQAAWVGTVDAVGGAVRALDSIELNLASTFVTATGHGFYSGTHDFLVGSQPDDYNGYRLEDVNGNEFLIEDSYTFDETGLHYTSAYCESHIPDFGDGRLFNSTNSTMSANGQTAAVDAYIATAQTWQMFAALFGDIGPNVEGRPSEVMVHWRDRNAVFDPRARRLKIGYPSLTGKTLRTFATTDITAHELGHDFFVSRVYADPVDPDMVISWMGGLNEATGDIIGFLTEAFRDAHLNGGLTRMPDRTLLTPANLTIGEEADPAQARSMLTPPNPIATPSLPLLDPHAIAGPIDRMYLLMAYGCVHSSTPPPFPIHPVSPPNPWACAAVPGGFPGIGPQPAGKLWECVVNRLSPGSSFRDARDAALDRCARTDDGRYGGPHTTAVADAFAEINVGPPADTIPPTATVTCHQEEGITPCLVNITDNENPDRYERNPTLTIDGTLVMPVIGFHSTVLVPNASLSGGVHNVVLDAWDLWGNHAQATTAVTLDKAGPIVSVGQSGSLKLPFLSVSASDTAGVLRVELRDGATLLATDATAPYTFPLDTSTWADGVHPLTVTALDVFGNATVVAHPIKADNTAPVVTINAGNVGPPFAISATASDASVLVQAQFKIDGLLMSTDTAAPFEWSYVPVDPLAHNLNVDVTDEYGNVGHATVPAPHDSQPPVVLFTPHQSGAIVRIDVSMADQCGLLLPFDFYLDGTPFTTLTSDVQTVTFPADLPLGTHTAGVLVADHCGNAAFVSAPFEKTESKPIIGTPLRDDSMPKKPKFVVSCTSDVGVDHVELRRGGVPISVDTTAPYELTVDTTGWTDGTSETLLIQCFDTNGFGSDLKDVVVTADNVGPSFTFTVHGSGHQWTVSADSLIDFHGVQSLTLTGGVIGGFSITRTASPWAYVWVIPAATTIQTTLPFSATATDDWGNVTARSGWCYLDTTNNTPRYLSCSGL